MLFWSFYIDMPHCDLQMIEKHSFVLKKIGDKYKNPALIRDPHFTLVINCFYFNNYLFWMLVFILY